MTYHSWHWDMSVFCHSGWDDYHLLPYFFRSLQWFPGDLVRSLGKDATLDNVLQMLDEDYGVVMTFNALSKELYSLKKGMGQNVAGFRVCLSQQVQILQMEYPGRIQQEHVEEVKQDCFYEGLCHVVSVNVGPQGWWWKFCHLFWIAPCCPETGKMGGSQQPPALKTTTAGSSNIVCSHSQGNLFPSRKFKGSCTFTVQSTVVEDHEAEEDSGPRPDREREVGSSAGEDAGMLGKVGYIDPSLGYIMQFANVVDLYKKKNCNCFRCGSPDHLVKDCPKELGKTARNLGLNLKEGMAKKGGQSSQMSVATQQATPGDAPWA